MNVALVALLLAAPIDSTVFRDTDGGWTVRTTTGGSSGGPSSSVSVSNFPAVQPISASAPLNVYVVDAGPVPVFGQVNVGNFPAQNGTWFPDGGSIGSVSVANFPSTQNVSVTNPTQNVYVVDAGALPVFGTVQIGNTLAARVPVYLELDGGLVGARITGNAGGVLDAANNGTAPANVLVAGAQLQSGATATAGTAGQVGSIVAGLDHVLYARFGGPVTWSCFVPLTTTATTQCQAAPAAGLRNYVTSINCSNGAATVQGVDVVYGTGSNCGTGTTALSHKFQMGTNALTTSPFQTEAEFNSPLVPATATAICVRPTAATAFGCTMTGFTAP